MSINYLRYQLRTLGRPFVETLDTFTGPCPSWIHSDTNEHGCQLVINKRTRCGQSTLCATAVESLEEAAA